MFSSFFFRKKLDCPKPTLWQANRPHDVRGYIKVGQETWKIQVSNEKNGCLGYIGDEQLPRYIGSMKNHDKDPY